MKHICTKFVAMLLVIAMIAGVLPFAFAANVGPFTDVKDTDWFASYAVSYTHLDVYKRQLQLRRNFGKERAHDQHVVRAHQPGQPQRPVRIDDAQLLEMCIRDRQGPQEKVEYIKDALRYFKLI